MVKKCTQYHYAVRLTKRRADLTKGDKDLLKEMKHIRLGGRAGEDLPDSVEGANSEDEIASKFREVY